MKDNFNLKMLNSIVTKKLFLSTLTVFISSNLWALPWDTDLYNQQSLKSTEIARAPVPGTVPVGYEPFNMTIEEADKRLSNPVQFKKDSVTRGQRLWGMQCSACHGPNANSETKIGKLLGAPNLTESRFSTYSDGKIYATIVLGVRGMPRYGYKLSDAERWDVVNYLRFLQGKDIAGLTRPEAEK